MGRDMRVVITEFMDEAALDGFAPGTDALYDPALVDDRVRRLLDAAALGATKRGAVPVNTARGGIVDEAALADALRSGHLAGAALDVFAEEPLGPEAGAVFEGVPNLILTPHIAGVTREANERVSALTVAQVRAALEA